MQDEELLRGSETWGRPSQPSSKSDGAITETRKQGDWFPEAPEGDCRAHQQDAQGLWE